MMRGIRIAEGDVLVLSIRTFSDTSRCRQKLDHGSGQALRMSFYWADTVCLLPSTLIASSAGTRPAFLPSVRVSWNVQAETIVTAASPGSCCLAACL